MFRVKHFSTKRSITKHRKHIFFNRNAFLRSCMTGCQRHFSAQNVKNNFEKDEMTITKSHFQTIEKQNLFLNRHILPQQLNHNTYQSIQTHKTAIDDCNRRQVKTKKSTCLWQNQGGQIVSQGILDENKPLSRPIWRWKATNPHKTDVSQDTKISLKIAKI